MAGERDIDLKIGLDSDELAAGADRVEQELAQIGDAGKTAGAEASAGLGNVAEPLQAVEEGARDAWSEFEKLGEEGRDAANALRTLEKTADAPRALAKNAGLAAFQVEDLVNELKAAGPAGEESLKKLSRVMKDAEKAIEGAANKAARMKDTVGDLGAKSAMAGDSLATLRGNAGSLDSMFDRMRETGTGATKALGTIGVAAGVAGAAVMGAVAAGREFAKAIDEWDAKRAKKDKAAADAEVKARLLDQANRAVTRGLIEQGKTTDETVMRYVEMTVMMGRLTEQGRAYIASVAGMKAPAAWADVERQANAMAVALVGAYKRSEEEGHRWALANAGAIKGMIAEYDRVGKVVPEVLVKALAEAEKWAATNEKAAAAARAMGAASAEAVVGVTLLVQALQNIGKVETKESIEQVSRALQEMQTLGGSDAVAKAVTQNFEALQKLRLEAEKDGDTLTKFRQQIMDQLPAYQATALAAGDYAAAVDEINRKYEEWEAARRAVNQADIEGLANMGRLRDEALQLAYAIDTIGEAWTRATGQAAGFTAEVRRSTKEVEEADPEFTAFIERLAGVSDEYERMVPYIGSLIAKLEKNEISIEQFNAALAEMRAGFIQIQGMSGNMFGDLEGEFNKLQKLINDFLASKRRDR